jgi:hypothetical protein
MRGLGSSRPRGWWSWGQQHRWRRMGGRVGRVQVVEESSNLVGCGDLGGVTEPNWLLWEWRGSPSIIKPRSMLPSAWRPTVRGSCTGSPVMERNGSLSIHVADFVPQHPRSLESRSSTKLMNAYPTLQRDAVVRRCLTSTTFHTSRFIREQGHGTERLVRYHSPSASTVVNWEAIVHMHMHMA